MRCRTDQNAQSGFSLVELVVAMAVTLIISGAVLQLMTAGQSAFRREPELSDRQQSIRMAMDIIAQDLYGAGYGLPAFAQVFTDNLDAQGPMGSGGADADEIEIFAASDCPMLTVCEVSGAQLTTREMISSCYNLPSLVILANATEWHPYWAEAPGNASNASCPAGGGNNGGGNNGGGNNGGGNNGGGNNGGGNDGGGDDGAGGDDGDDDDDDNDRRRRRRRRRSSIDGAPVLPGPAIVNVAYTARGRSTITRAVITGRSRPSRVVRTANNSSRNGHVNFPPGHSVYNNPGGPNQVFTNPPEYMLVGQVIRYRIRVDSEGTPNLERSSFGGNDFPDGSSSWQTIARGVEDLQVQYLNGNGWQDTPGTTTCGANCGAPTMADYDTIIRRVRVRLSARALAENLKGQTSSAVGDAVRGELVSEFAPRPSTTTLGLVNGEL